MILQRFRARGQRKIDFGGRVDEDQPDRRIPIDFMLFAAAQVGDKSVAVGPRLERSRAQPGGRAGGEHANLDTLNNPPNAIEMTFLRH